MLISDQHEFIFVHIPKTAGTSIRTALQPYSLERPSGGLASLLRRFDLPKDYRKHRFKLHTTLAQLQSKMVEDKFMRYKKICFVRNPWDRAVSSFAYDNFGTDDKQRRHQVGFMAHLESMIKSKPVEQIEYIYDQHGQHSCDFVGRYESLPDDYSALSELLNIELPPLERRNSSKRKRNYTDYYDQQAIDFVATHWARDIDAFGYDFGD
ncbi:MAG: sulfotransferase family 2 domain-containing protein [Pseudomonadota bacterium]